MWAMFLVAILGLLAFPALTARLASCCSSTATSAPASSCPRGLVLNNVPLLAADGQLAAPGRLAAAVAAPVLVPRPSRGLHPDAARAGLHLRHPDAPSAAGPSSATRRWCCAMLAIGCLSFIVWGHHMFVSGMSPYLGMAFAVGTILIAVPSAVKVFNWLATLWRSRIRFTTPMLWAHGRRSRSSSAAASRASGWRQAAPGHPPPRHVCSWSAHFHLIMAGAALFGVFGATSFWFPKMFGRMMNEPLGKTALLVHVRHLLRHVLPDALHRHRRPPAAHLRSLPVRVPEAAAAASTSSSPSAPSSWAPRSSSSS